MKRKKIIAGNWKMNTSISEGIALAAKLVAGHITSDPQMIIIPPFTHLLTIKSILDGSPIVVGAQNCHQEAKGAFTGEVSAPMLKSCEILYVIVGHSERRQYFIEDDAVLAKKLIAILGQNLIPIYCIGESLDTRNAGLQNKFVLEQLQAGLFHLSASDFSKVILAYEPLWAIGTGVTASPQQAQDMHAFIRAQIQLHYGVQVADHTSILYGGSVKGSNAKDIFAGADVDGALVGGASLDYDDFLKIANGF